MLIKPRNLGIWFGITSFIIGCIITGVVMLRFFTHTRGGYDLVSLAGDCLNSSTYNIGAIRALERALPLSVDNLTASANGFNACTVYLKFDVDLEGYYAFLGSAEFFGIQPTMGIESTSFAIRMRDDMDWTFDVGRPYYFAEGGNGRDITEYMIADVHRNMAIIYLIVVLS